MNIVDTVFCPDLKSKFSSIESCFGSGIHFTFNPNLSKISPNPYNPNFVEGSKSVSIQSNFIYLIQICPNPVQVSLSVKSKFPSLGFESISIQSNCPSLGFIYNIIIMYYFVRYIYMCVL